MLSPMAGVTNQPFRQICREEELAGHLNVGDGFSGLYVDEMIAARALSARISKVHQKVTFAQNESFRSVQLHCVDSLYAGKAAEVISKENLADHIDLNFGCPMRKVTRNGGGSAIPAKPELLRDIIREVVKNAGDIPVSAKFRLGLSSDEMNYLQTATIAADEGCQMVILHARTTDQYYGGEANWEHIKKLREFLPDDILVFGNGDVWGAKDAIRMIEMTSADGVAIGRGAQGRPWLFRDLAEIFDGNFKSPYQPCFSEVRSVMLHHLKLMVDWIGSEITALKAFRVHIGQYLKGFPIGKDIKVELMKQISFESFERLLNLVSGDLPYPKDILDKPRGRTKTGMKVHLPHGWNC